MVGLFFLFSFFFLQKYLSQTQLGSWWDFFSSSFLCKNIYLKHKREDGGTFFFFLCAKIFFPNTRGDMVGLFSSFFFLQKYLSQTQVGRWWDFFLLLLCAKISFSKTRGEMVGLFSFFFSQKYLSQTQEGRWWDFFCSFFCSKMPFSLFFFLFLCKNDSLKHKRGDGTWHLVLLMPKNIFFLQGFHCEWPSQLAASNRRWKVGCSVVSFCARERILINFFKIRCLSQTGPNCRQCEASNTLACKFLKKKFSQLFLKTPWLQNLTLTDCKQRYTTFWLYSFKQGRGNMAEGGKQSHKFFC